ncbi:D-arabinono-1,4-lactone oxidase [Aeromicrobium sp.]|uniref:D-arabinono-1,4-lactone oxidase n=1 Tax=Aeromicrobium sp. TaxID=1871063 RepID=UPI003D6B4C3D
MTARETWTNWSRSVEAHPEHVEHPASTAEVVSLVQVARSQGLPVKAYGAGHSFTPIAATDGYLLRLDRMNHLLARDTTSRRVLVQAGMSLRELNPELLALGLALPNLGDVDPQSVAGAISTGTHGTGGKLHGIAAAVVGVQLVTAEGDVVEIDEQHPWFDAARVSLGALGIITEVTLQCEPAFLLHAREEPMALPEVIERLPELIEENDHFEFYWFPHTEKALVKRNNRVADGTRRDPVSRFRHLVDDELLSNGVFGLLNEVGARRRSLVPRINGVTGSALSAREFTDHSHEVFVSPRRVRFRESEFAMPRSALPGVIAGLQAWFDAGHETVSFPIEVRFTGSDDIWMSTGHERDNCYVAVHHFFRSDPTAYFAAAQDIFTAHEGRPHWGKMNTVDASYLRDRYARFDDFVAVRDEADLKRVFTNPYLDRVLG